MKKTQTRAVQQGDLALYSAIILFAIKDAKQEKYKFNILSFISSDWFTFLCRALDIHHGLARRTIKREYIYEKKTKSGALDVEKLYI